MAELWALNTLSQAHEFISQKSPAPVVVLKNFIGGQFTRIQADELLDIFEPKTGLVIGKVPISTEDDVQRAVDSASAAFPSWSQTPRKQRSEYLLRVADVLRDNRELFAVWESIDQGKTIERARVEVDRAISNFQSDIPKSQGILTKSNGADISRPTFSMKKPQHE